MYQLVTEPVAWIDVDWTSLDVGGPDEASVQVDRSLRLKVAFLPRSELVDLLAGKQAATIEEIALKVTRDWAGVVDEDKRPITFSADLLARILEHEPGFASGFEISFVRASLGQGKVREKNSEGSPEGGRADETAATKPARKSS